MIGPFAGGATASLAAKNGKKNYFSCLKTDFDVYGVQNNYIEVVGIIRSFTNKTSASQGAKI